MAKTSVEGEAYDHRYALRVAFPADRRAELDALAAERGMHTSTLVRSIVYGWVRDLKSNLGRPAGGGV